MRRASTNLLAKAERAAKAEQLRTLPKLRSAARNIASAMEILMNAPQATEDRLVSLAEVWDEIERVVPREKLTAAVATIASFVPAATDDYAAAVRRGRVGEAVPDGAAGPSSCC